MKVLYDVCDKAKDELRQICNKPELTQMDVENMYKLIDIVKDVTTIEAMKNAEDQGWSREYSREYSRTGDENYSNVYPIYKMARDGESNESYSYRRDGGSNDGYSYRRGRDSMGRYTSREEGYSRHNKAGMIEDLKEMMMNARSEEERESYRKTIENLTRN